MLRMLQKSPTHESQEIISSLLHTNAELSKIFYKKAAGIDPIFLKGLLQLYSSFLKEASNKECLLATLKSLGVFVIQAALAPSRMQQFYKEILDFGIESDLA
jgi:hypothetical protein